MSTASIVCPFYLLFIFLFKLRNEVKCWQESYSCNLFITVFCYEHALKPRNIFQVALGIKYSMFTMKHVFQFTSSFGWERGEEGTEQGDSPKLCCGPCVLIFLYRWQGVPISAADCWMNTYSENHALLESVFAQLSQKHSMGKSHNACISDFMNLAFSFW